MTAKDRDGILLQILDNQESLKGKVEGIEGSVKAIHRAVYGDKENRVKGLLQRQDEDEERHGDILKMVQDNTNKITPLLQVHNFVTSGKLWKTLVAIGTVIMGIIGYLKLR